MPKLVPVRNNLETSRVIIAIETPYATKSVNTGVFGTIKLRNYSANQNGRNNANANTKAPTKKMFKMKMNGRNGQSTRM